LHSGEGEACLLQRALGGEGEACLYRHRAPRRRWPRAPLFTSASDTTTRHAAADSRGYRRHRPAPAEGVGGEGDEEERGAAACGEWEEGDGEGGTSEAAGGKETEREGWAVGETARAKETERSEAVVCV